jgi:adenylylsulfate kinase
VRAQHQPVDSLSCSYLWLHTLSQGPPLELRPVACANLRGMGEFEEPAARAEAGATRTTGFILWFTGLSGAGKSTLARAMCHRLAALHPVELLDGDEVRTSLSRGLGFTRPDREENVRRIGYVARVLARHRVAVLVAAISPYRDSREEVRQLAAAASVPFIEVYVQAPLQVLIERDVKGLYKKALAGEILHFTGISDPYEPPEQPELIVHSDAEAVEQAVERLLAVLRERALTSLT